MAVTKSVSCVLGFLLSLVLFTGCSGMNRIPVKTKKTEKDLLREQYEKMQREAVAAKADAAQARDEAEVLRAELETCRNQPGQGQGNSANQASTNQGPGQSTQQVDQIDGVEVLHDGSKITMRMQGDILFAPGKVTLKTTAKASLKKVASEIKKKFKGHVVRIEGYSDKTKITKSKWKDNLELSLQRAAAVHRYLQSEGISSSQMYAAGYGATRLRKTDSQSRRVEIVVLKP